METLTARGLRRLVTGESGFPPDRFSDRFQTDFPGDVERRFQFSVFQL